MNQLFALVPDALADMRAIFARRWWLLLVVAVLPAAFTLWKSAAGIHGVDRDGLELLAASLVLVVVIVLSAYIFADTMRLADPSYGLTVGRVLILVLIGFGVALIGVALSLPVLLFRSSWPMVAEIWTLVVEMFVTARLGYVFFAAEHEDGPFGYSWRITSGAAFLPSLVLAAIYGIGVAVLQALAGVVLQRAPLGASLVGSYSFLITTGAAMFFSPWMIRWMRVAESMQTVVPE